MLRKKNQPSKIEKRVAKIATPDLISWAEQALYTMGRNLTDYIKTNNKNVLDETTMGAEALLAIMHELKRRT